MERLRDGDGATERHFVHHFSVVIRLMLRYRLRSPELIEDVRQETFLRVIRFVRAGNTLDHPERLGAYVHTVCLNVMMEQLRSSTRHPQLPDDGRQFIDSSADPEKDATTAQTMEVVREVLQTLPQKDREILKLIFLEERDKSDVCRQYQVDRDYLRVLVYRAKLRFKAALLQKGVVRNS